MIAYLLNCQCDSIVTKACGALIPVVRETYEAGTNCYDAAIAFFICVAIILVALILKCAFLSWKNQEIGENKDVREFKKKKEDDESERKQKSDLLDKYLDFLKEQASKDDKLIQDYKDVLAGFKESLNKGTDNEKIVSILKNQMEFLKGEGFKSNGKAEREYKQVLAYLIQLSQQGKFNEFSKEKLNDLFKQKSTDEN